jgi:hypothetical protein
MGGKASVVAALITPHKNVAASECQAFSEFRGEWPVFARAAPVFRQAAARGRTAEFPGKPAGSAVHGPVRCLFRASATCQMGK